MNTTKEILCSEFEAFCAANNLPTEGDAVDMLWLDLTDAQRRWLSEFILRWDASNP